MATYILFWNPGISSYNRDRFLADFRCEYGVGNWSFWDYEKIQPGDIFYMVRCGDGNRGVAMKGVIITEAYASRDRSPKNRRNIHYANIYQNFTINTFATNDLLTPEMLTKEIPGFNWYGGHSGQLLDPESAAKLDKLWDKYRAEHPYLVKDGLAFINQAYVNP